jgi:general secretion pathway protein B
VLGHGFDRLGFPNAGPTGLQPGNCLQAVEDVRRGQLVFGRPLHVFSGEPADRFVFINMTKYRENSKLSEGPVIKQITADGVVLEYQGTDFLLPRE